MTHTTERPIVQVIVASTREERLGGAVADWVMEQHNDGLPFDLELVDLRQVNLPVHSEPNHPRTGVYTQDTTKRWSNIVKRGDGFIFVTPEYNHSIPAGLKNALDHLNDEWRRKPAGFVSYGGVSAGTRAVEAILTTIACFEMRPVMQQVNIPFVGELVTDGKFSGADVQVAAARAMFNGIAEALSV